MARREWQNPKLQTRVGAKGEEYYIRYRVRVLIMKDGQPFVERREKWHPLGLCAEVTKRQAERERDRIMREVNGQIYQIQSHIPFPEFLKIYRQEHYRGLKETSKDYYEQRIRAWIEPSFKDKKLYQIGSLDVTMMLGAMERAGVARTTRNATKAILGNIFERARKWGYLKDRENPARDAEVGRSNEGGRQIWTPSLLEAQRIVACADEQVGVILELIIWTGMRISEALGLRSGNVDVAQCIARVDQGSGRYGIETPKTPAGRRILPIGYLARKLKPLLGEKDDFVFRQADGSPWTDQLLYRRVRAAMDKAKLYHPGNAWHAIRRLHLTLMSSHISLFDLRAQAGHTDLKTTQRYVQPDLKSRQRALKKLQANVVPIRRGA